MVDISKKISGRVFPAGFCVSADICNNYRFNWIIFSILSDKNREYEIKKFIYEIQ